MFRTKKTSEVSNTILADWDVDRGSLDQRIRLCSDMK